MRESRFWLLHMASAIVLLVFLGLHMGIMHLDGTLAMIREAWVEPLAWQSVLTRAKSTFFTVTYILLLAAALFHGLYGLRTVVLELGVSAAARRFTTVLLWSAGVGLFVLGTYALVAMHVLATQS